MSTSPTELTADLPWRGSQPYTEPDRAFFHGRKREIEELRLLLQRDSLLLITGATAVGKTSLVRAGLLPSLGPDWLAVPLEPDWGAASDQRPVSRQILDAVAVAAQARSIEGPKIESDDSLWEAFHRKGARWWNSRQRPVTPVIVLDQFETAFTDASANATTRRHRDRFLEELSQLIANRPPSRVASRLEDGTEPVDAFDFGPVPVRVVLVMREEALPQLYTIRSLVPNIQHSEFRLSAFTEAQARDVLVRAGSHAGLFAPGVVDQLLPQIALGNDRDHPFSPSALSIQARELAECRTTQNATQITSDFLTARQSFTADVAPPISPSIKSDSSSVQDSRPARSNSPALGPLVLILLAVVGLTLWNQRELRNDVEAMKARSAFNRPELALSAPPGEPAPQQEAPTPPGTNVAERATTTVPEPSHAQPLPAIPASKLSNTLATETSLPLAAATPEPLFGPRNSPATVPPSPTPASTAIPTPTSAPSTPTPSPWTPASAPPTPAPPTPASPTPAPATPAPATPAPPSTDPSTPAPARPTLIPPTPVPDPQATSPNPRPPKPIREPSAGARRERERQEMPKRPAAPVRRGSPTPAVVPGRN